MTLQKSHGQRKAYTLFELIIVMALMVILAAIAMPMALQRTHDDVKVAAAADVVKARWAECRAQAVEDNRPYMFSIVPNSGKYKVEAYGGTSLVGSGLIAGSGLDTNSAPRNNSGESGGLVHEDTLPSGVRFGTKEHPVSSDSGESDGEYVPVAIFLPEGGAVDDVEIHFGAKGARTVTLRLRSLTATSSSDVGEVLK